MGDEISVILYREGKIVRSRTEIVPSVLPFTEVVPKNVELIDLNSPRSASRANSSNDGESAGRKPPLLSLSRSLCSRLRCSAVVSPTMAARHIAGRRRWSVWQPVAALEDEGRATEEFLRQIVMTHMMMFDLYDRSCSVVDSRSPPTLSKYRRVRLLV